MAGVRVTRTLNNQSAFARSVEQATAKAAFKQLSAVVDEAENEAKRVVSTELVNDRTGYRRKKGAARLLNGIQVVLDQPNGPGTFPVNMIGKARGDQKKIAALEFGSPPHSIEPNEADRLVFPSSGDARSTSRAADGSVIRLESGKASLRARQQGLAKNNRLARQKLVKADYVEHPGNRAYGFLRRGMERAIRAAFN